MNGNKSNRKIGKGKVAIIAGLLLLFIFLFQYMYNPSTAYYGTVTISELKEVNNEYYVVVEGDFGLKISTFNEEDTFDIRENEERREGNMTDIWSDLSEDESFHVLLEADENRHTFHLETIYLD